MDPVTIGLLLGQTKKIAGSTEKKLENMTVSATQVNGAPTAEFSSVNDHFHLALGLPKGDTGAAGVGAKEIAQALPTRTVSGQEVTFDDAADGLPAESLVVEINLVQEGEGRPSAQNVRPIHGWDRVTVHAPKQTITEDWQKLQAYGAARYPVGSSVIAGSYKGDYLEWEVADYGTKLDPATGKVRPCVTLLSKDCVGAFYYKFKEALYYVDAAVFPDGMPAGTYYFTCVDRNDYTDDNNKNYQFTLTQTVPVGGQFVVTTFLNRTLENTQLAVFTGPSSFTEMFRVKLTVGNEGTYLGATDGNTPYLNHGSRLLLGNNNYEYSDIRQWMNSAGEGRNWCQPVTPFGRNDGRFGYAEPGLLTAFSADFLAAVAQTRIAWRTNSVYEGHYDLNTEYTVLDKFFLPSLEELGMGGEGTENQTWALYVGKDRYGRRKRRVDGTGIPWATRNVKPDSTTYLYDIDSSGDIMQKSAQQEVYVAPACILWMDTEDTVTCDFTETVGTVYGGTLDVISGVLKVTKKCYENYNNESVPRDWISSMDVFNNTSIKPTKGAQVVYDLYRPEVYQLTPLEVRCLLANNHFWCDSGNVTVKYHMDVAAYVEKRLAEWQQEMEAAAGQDGGE